MLGKLKEEFLQSIQKINRHFKEAQQQIARNNLLTLLTFCLCGIFLVGFLLAVTPLLIPGWSISLWHGILVALFAVFAGVSAHQRTIQAGYKTVHITVLVFMFLLLAAVMGLDLIPYANSSATLIAIAMVAVPVVFIVPFYETVGLLLVVLGLFLLVNHLFVDPVWASRNVFHGLLATGCGILLSWIVTNIRAEDNRDRQTILHQSQLDKLTGIANKYAVEKACEVYLDAAVQRPCALIVLDIDYFKLVNDQYGHHAGDRVLSAVGECIRGEFRDSDLYGRIGGDEFLILMDNTPSPKVVRDKFRHFEKALQQRILQDTNLSVTCSYGALFKAENEKLPYLSLFKMADRILYRCKREGKACGRVMSTEDYQRMVAKREVMLVVDDVEINREVLRNLFENDFEVIEATNGQEAIELIRKHHGIISIMLLDIMMPVVDGFDVLKWIKVQPDISAFPVIAISSDSKKELQSLELGVADMISKPFDPEVIRQRVANAMKLHRTQKEEAVC